MLSLVKEERERLTCSRIKVTQCYITKQKTFLPKKKSEDEKEDTNHEPKTKMY